MFIPNHTHPPTHPPTRTHIHNTPHTHTHPQSADVSSINGHIASGVESLTHESLLSKELLILFLTLLEQFSATVMPSCLGRVTILNF